MPWLNDSQPDNASSQKWKTVFRNAFLRRLNADQLSGSLQALASKYPAPPDEVSSILLGFRARENGNDDPLLFRYSQMLLQLKIVATNHLLLALLQTSRFTKRPGYENVVKPSAGLPTCEERVFNMLTQMHMSGEVLLRPSNFHSLVYALVRWMRFISEYETGKQLEGGALHAVDAFSFGMYEAFASLTFTILGSATFRSVAKQPWWKIRRGLVVSELENFDTHVLQWMQSQLGGRLRALATMPPFIETGKDGKPIFTDEQILQGIPDLQIMTSRAGLYVWLNACLCSRPLTDDLAMLTYLQNRFSGNTQSLVVDLIVASFDVLTSAILRKDSEHAQQVIKSFICNKVPHLLGTISGFMTPPLTVEACAQMAFMSITMDALPPISAGSNEVRERLKVTRFEFLQAGALHGLISESAVFAILQEPTTMPKANRYTKENLLAQCSNNVGRLEPLIDELDGMVGNAGSIAGCIVDTVSNLCLNKDTISLKTVCSMLIKKISRLDVILQYTQPANLLLPLCQQLNEWTHDQDQTEFTPAYEEFASILLFLLSAVHRYGLSRSDIGLPTDDSFIARLLQETSSSRQPNDLTEEESKQLTKWIDGLYATDDQGETGGISDEVMRSCTPQAFYQLVPTLFEQSVLACRSNKLTLKTFKGGLELLVEPFLLPSLIGGLSWLIKHSWEDHGDADTLLHVLEKLLKPSTSSQETKAMHKAILGIIADPLYYSLQILGQRQPEKKTPSTFMNILKPHLDTRRTMEANKTEVDCTSTTDGAISDRIRKAVQELVLWVSNVGPTPPPQYTHKLFAFGCETIGMQGVKDALVAELKEQTILGNGPVALDVCTAIICAPLATAQSQATSLVVRDVVRLHTTNLQNLLETAAMDAEALVRLHRKVKAQLAVTQISQLPMAMAIPDQNGDQVMAELGLTDESLAAPAADASLDQVAILGRTAGAEFSNADLNSMLDEAMNVTNQPTQSLGELDVNMNMDQSAMPMDQEDIFKDLDMEMTQPPQQMLNPDGTNMNMGTDGQQKADDDIFDDLDLDQDFDFS